MALTISTALPTISLNGNPVKTRIHTDNLFDGSERRPFYTIILNVYDSNDVLYMSFSAEPDDDGYAWFDLKEAFIGINPTVTFPISEVTPVVADIDACKEFYFKLAEGYGIPYEEQAETTTSSPFWVIPGGISDWALRLLDEQNKTWYDQLTYENPWLTNQPNNKVVLPGQPEQLRFLDLYGPDLPTSLKVARFFADGSTETVTLWTGTLQDTTIYSVNASREFCAGDAIRYELWMEVPNILLTNRASFIVSDIIPENTRFVLFRNSLGGFDCGALTGRFISELETHTTEFHAPQISRIRDSLLPQQERALGIRYLKGQIGWKNNEELLWFTEILLSENRYMIVDERLETVVIVPERKQVGSDGFEPKSMNLEFVIGVPDFFFLNLP